MITFAIVMACTACTGWHNRYRLHGIRMSAKFDGVHRRRYYRRITLILAILRRVHRRRLFMRSFAAVFIDAVFRMMVYHIIRW